MARVLAALCALACGVVAQPLYEFDDASPIVQLDDANFEQRMSQDASAVWVVEFYADWCGHCKQFAKGYLKAADNLRGIVKFGAVNAEKNPKTASANGVQGYPTVKLFMPEQKRNPYTGKMHKPVLEYNGPRTARGVVDFATAAIPSSYVIPLKDGGLNTFLANGSLPKAVLLGSKPEVTPLLKSMGVALRDRMLIGSAHGPSSAQIATTLAGSDATFPKLVVVPAGGSLDQAVTYMGEMKPAAILEFLTSYAATPPQPEAQRGTDPQLVRELDAEALGSLPKDAHIIAFGDVEGLEPLAESVFGQAVVGRAPVDLASEYGVKKIPGLAVLKYGAAEKAPKKAIRFAADASGLDAAKKAALTSLPEKQVERLHPANLDPFFSTSFSSTPTRAACLLFSEKSEVPPLYRALALAFEGQLEFGFAPASLMAQFQVEKAPALLIMFPAEMPPDAGQEKQIQLQGARFTPQVHGKFNYGNIATFIASFIQTRLHELGASAGPSRGAQSDDEEDAPKAATRASKDVGPIPELTAATWDAECASRGGLCAVALLDGSSDNSNKQSQLDMLTKLRARRAGGPLAFSWLDATCHVDFVSAFGLTETDLPTMLVISPSKLRWARAIGSFDAETLGAFGMGVASGRKATESIDAIPTLQEVDCASVPRGAAAVVEEDDPLADEIMAEILEEERREREAREAEAAAAAAAAAGGQSASKHKDQMSELERMESELEECGSMDLLCAARREKQLKAIEKKRQLEEKLKKIAKKKKKAKAKAKKA